jgi:hypothetical protein
METSTWKSGRSKIVRTGSRTIPANARMSTIAATPIGWIAPVDRFVRAVGRRPERITRP